MMNRTELNVAQMEQICGGDTCTTTETHTSFHFELNPLKILKNIGKSIEGLFK